MATSRDAVRHTLHNRDTAAAHARDAAAVVDGRASSLSTRSSAIAANFARRNTVRQPSPNRCRTHIEADDNDVVIIDDCEDVHDQSASPVVGRMTQLSTELSSTLILIDDGNVARTDAHGSVAATAPTTQEAMADGGVPSGKEKVYSTVYSRLETWAACNEEVVECLPPYVDGLCKFVIRCSLDDMMSASKDCRPWRTWVTTSRRGFAGRRRLARCRGRYVCRSTTCSYLAAHKCANTVQFVTRDNRKV